MDKGQRVMIANTNSVWDGMEGIVEEIGDGKCTVLVDFSPNKGKKVRQDFSEECLAEIDGHVDAQSTLGKGNGGLHMAESKVCESVGQESRMEALARFLGVDSSEVEEGYEENAFKANGEEWLVLTLDEAKEKAEEQVREIYDDMGLESFTTEYQRHIIDNFVDTDGITSWIEEYYQSYIEDIEDEDDSNYGTRLYQEMHEQGILSDDDFEEDEDGNTMLKADVDLDSKKEMFADKLVADEDPMDWLRGIYTERELAKVLEESGLIDVDAVAEDCVETDGIAHFLASWDGEESDLGDGLLGYRVN